MLGKRFLFQGRKKCYFLIKVSIQNEEMQDFECFFMATKTKKFRLFSLKIINIIFFK